MSVVVALAETRGARADGALVASLLACAQWRAPHGGGIWAEEAACIGVAAFRIAEDEDDPGGPFALGDLHLAGNVRLDDRETLTGELKARGAPVGPRTPDALLLLHAWRQWGNVCLERVTGDFAFVLWDAESRCLTAAHDHYGVEPLYYSRTSTGLVVSNSLACMATHPGIDLALDERAVADHLTFGMKLEIQGTFFRGINRLAPGEWLEFRDGALQVRRYWQPDIVAAKELRWRGSTYIEEFREIFDRAVSDRLRCRNVSTHLSGGMDASSIAVTLAKLMGPDTPSRLRAFTTEFEHLIPDEEGNLARTIAAFAGLPLSVRGADDASVHPPTPPGHVSPEPGRIHSDPAGISFLSDAERHGPVMFAGFGGDPLCAPKQRSKEPTSMIEHAIRLNYLLTWGWRLHNPFATMARGLFRRSHGHGFEQNFSWLDADFTRRVRAQDRFGEWYAMAARPDIAAMASAPLWSNIFEQSSPDFTGHRLQFVYPFFDRRIVRFVERVPIMPWRRRKLLLRFAMRGRLPSQILHRPKQGLRGDPGTAALEHYGPQPWMRELLRNDALRAWIDVDENLRQLNDPAARNPWTYTRLSFIWRLSWWLANRPAPTSSKPRS